MHVPSDLRESLKRVSIPPHLGCKGMNQRLNCVRYAFAHADFFCREEMSR
jgi:hypothetical protein